MADRRQQTEKEREAKRQERAERFWDTFRFTENGKPKSSFGIYTFSLSIAFIAVYVLCYEGAIRILTDPLSQLTPFLANLLIALLSSIAGTAICCLPHRFFQDKRLVFGGYLWLCVYAAAVLLIMAILMGFSEGFVSFLVFFGWFIALPVVLGTAVSAWLFRRDYRSENSTEKEPEYKKYLNHRI